MVSAAEMLIQAWQHLQAGASARAEEIYRQVLQDEPLNADAFFGLGLVEWNKGRLEEAASHYQQALRCRPDFFEAQNNLGNVFVVQGKWAEAAQVYREILARRPDFAGAHNNLGYVLRNQGRLEEALASYRESLRLQPDFFEAHYNLGDLLLMMNRLEPAVASTQQALRLRPASPEANMILGTALAKLGRMDEAAPPLRRALELRPAYGDAHVSLGNVLWAKRQLAEAEASFREAVRLMPGRAEVHYNLGLVFADQGRLDEAIPCYREALRLNPRYVEAHGNLGNALGDLGRLDEALACYHEALRLNPRYTNAHQNLANALRRQGKPVEALAVYEELLRLQPDVPEAHLGLAFASLLLGDFARGWPEYEWRWRCRDFGGTAFAQPLWNGSSLEGRAILLRCEQGMGDTLQFIRYAPLVKARGAARVILLCPKATARLFAGFPGVDEVLVPGTGPLPPVDCHAPLLSLPGIFGTTFDTIPANVPYLHADPTRIDFWRGELSGPGLKVGLHWQGNRTHKDDRQRSVPLSKFAPLAAVPGVKLYSFQQGAGSEQAATAPFPIVHLGDRIGDFAETAAAVCALDLVVTVDSALAHLAGGLGVPVWVGLAFAPDWRWLLDRDDSPWYPSMRLFRQTEFGNWDSVFTRMAAALGALAQRQQGTASDLLDRLAASRARLERSADDGERQTLRAEREALTARCEASRLLTPEITALTEQLQALWAQRLEWEHKLSTCQAERNALLQRIDKVAQTSS